MRKWVFNSTRDDGLKKIIFAAYMFNTPSNHIVEITKSIIFTLFATSIDPQQFRAVEMHTLKYLE